jgi:hypothetical protein
MLGRLAPVYLAIEGGPGTIHEAEVAHNRNAVVVPVGRTSGFVGDLIAHILCPLPACGAGWASLNDGAVGTDSLAEAVCRIVRELLAWGPNRVGGRIDLQPPTPPGKRVRNRRFRLDQRQQH